MLESENRKLALRCFALIVLISGLVLLTKERTRASLSSPQARVKIPVASVVSQDDAPLRIVSTFVETEPGVVRLKAMAQNQSGKSIRAYAIVADGGAGSRVDFANLTTPTAIIQPTQIKTFDISYGENEAPANVTLSIDFVEFGDGSTWGRDSYNSHDRLAGQREGAKYERRRLRELLKSKGPSAVFDAVREEVPDEPEIKATNKPSEEWIQGYRNGIGTIRYRLRQNLQTSDPARAELELSRPFDSSEEQP